MSVNITVRGGVLALLLAGTLIAGQSLAENEGQAELDQATEAKLTASTLSDLGEVIRLLETALEKGLDKDNTQFAQQLLAATRIERGLAIAQTVSESLRSDLRWPQFRRLALEDLEKGVQLNPKQPRALLAIAELNLLPGGDAKRASQALDQTIKLSSEEPLLRAKAFTLRAALQEDPQKKLADLNRAVRANAGDAAAFRARASVYVDQQKLELALGDLEKAIELDPDHAPTHQARAVLLIDLQRYDEALGCLDRAQQLAPKWAAPLLQRARVHGLQSQFKAALKDLDQAYLLEPDNLQVLLLRASVYQELDEPEKALADVDQALRLKPGLGPAMRLKALLLAGSGKFNQAIQQLEEVQKNEPEDVAVALHLAIFYNAEQRPRKAIEVYSQVLAEEPDNAIALQGRADALLSIGKHGEAIGDYEKALKLRPKDPSLLNNFAWVLATSPDDQLRDGQRAIQLATEACRLTKYKQDHILSTLAAAYAETGDFQTAIKWSQKAVEVGSEDQKEQLAKELESYRQNKPWRERQNTPERDQPEPPEKDQSEEPKPSVKPSKDQPSDKER